MVKQKVTTQKTTAKRTTRTPRKKVIEPKDISVPVYLYHQGTNFRSYQFFGAHLEETELGKGVTFRVWAPNALEVSVVGDFNCWDSTKNPMSRIPNSGVWELFVPGIGIYETYKYALKTVKSNGEYVLKADPFAFHAQTPPENASKTYDLSGYKWRAKEYEEKRLQTNAKTSPINIYELNLMSWRRNEDGSYYTYNQLAKTLVPYVKKMGYTHVEFMPVTEYPFDGSWGYQVTGYYAITSRLGTPHDFMNLIDTFHEEGIGVIIDWVPAHFPKDAFSLAEFDGTYLYEDANPLRREHKSWGTLIFDFGKTEIQSFLVSSAMFLFDVYHIDGIRVDAVASMLYLDYDRKDGEWQKNSLGTNINLESVAFLQKLNTAVKDNYPYALMIAEESTAFPRVTHPVKDGGLGFDYKWNMGWMNDVLSYVKTDPMFRSYNHNKLTFSMMYAFSENFILPISHDEVVHCKGSLVNKMPGDEYQKMSSVRAFMGYMMSHPGKKLMFMGQEYSQFSEWNYSTGLDFSLLEDEKHQKMQRFYADINAFYKNSPALYTNEVNWDGFRWLVANDSGGNIIAYTRTSLDKKQTVLVVINFSGVQRYDYRIGVEGEKYRLAFLSNDEKYGGYERSGDWVFTAEDIPCGAYQRSISVNLAPLSFMYLEEIKDENN